MQIMKNSVRYTWILTILFLNVVGILGCATKVPPMEATIMNADVKAKLISVRTAPPRHTVEFQEAKIYEDERLTATWLITSEGIIFTIINKGQTDALKILWNEVVITDIKQFVYDVVTSSAPSRIPEGAGVIVVFSRGEKDDIKLTHSTEYKVVVGLQTVQQSAQLAYGTKKYTILIPYSIHLIEDMSNWILTEKFQESRLQEVDKWMDEQLQAFKKEVESFNGKLFSVLIPMLDAGKEIEYLFTFKLQISIRKDAKERPS